MARRLMALIVTALATFAIASTATAHGATVFYTGCDAVSDTDTVKVKKIEEDGSGAATVADTGIAYCAGFPSATTAITGPSTVHVMVLLIGLPCTLPMPCRVNNTPNSTIRTPRPRIAFRMVLILPQRGSTADMPRMTARLRFPAADPIEDAIAERFGGSSTSRSLRARKLLR